MSKIITQQLNYNDVLIVPGSSSFQSRQEVNLHVQIGKYSVIPLIAANMDTVGTIEMAETLYKYQCMTALHKHYDLDTLVEWFKKPQSQYCFYSMGTRDQDINKFNAFVQAWGYPDYICVDVANGHTDDFINKCQIIRNRAVDSYIMAGNVVTADAALRLAQIGINCAKIGVGPGQSCLTRKQTGAGYPQLSAVMNCAQAAESHSSPFDVCADGGCVTSGDIAKALVGGANLVMIGGMLAGTNQSGGKIINKYKLNTEFTNLKNIIVKQQYMEFYGMSSDQAMKKFGGNTDYKTAEGRSMLVPYMGLRNTLYKTY